VHEGKILLEVRDNGVGIDDLESAQNKMTMGLKTILALGERQLKGKVVLKTDNGFSCEMEFDDSMYGTRV
jgi:two-component sensor histidine kinase